MAGAGEPQTTLVVQHLGIGEALARALAAMDELQAVLETPRMIRIVNLS